MCCRMILKSNLLKKIWALSLSSKKSRVDRKDLQNCAMYFILCFFIFLAEFSAFAVKVAIPIAISCDLAVTRLWFGCHGACMLMRGLRLCPKIFLDSIDSPGNLESSQATSR